MIVLLFDASLAFTILLLALVVVLWAEEEDE